MQGTSKALKRLGVTGLGAMTLLAMPSVGVAIANAAPASVTIESQATATGSTRSDGSNTTVKISANTTEPTSGGPAAAAVRFSYQPTATLGGSTTGPAVVIATDTTYPYAVEWAPPAAGFYNEIAEALDSSNTVISSATVAAQVADLPSVHITSPTDGANIGVFGGKVVVSGTRSSDKPAISVTIKSRDNSTGALSAAGTAGTVAAGGPTDPNAWSVQVPVPSCASSSCDLVIRAEAGTTPTWSDEVVVAHSYAQTLTTFTVAPTSATKPVNSPQTYTVSAMDQNGAPVAGLNYAVTATDPNSNASITPGNTTGTTGTDGTSTFTETNSDAETATFTVQSWVNGTSYNPANDFQRTATLTTYVSNPTTLAITADPQKAIYATQSEYTTGTPVVRVCVVDQNGNPTPNTAVPPANLIATVTRVDNTPSTPTTTTTPATLTQDTSTGHTNCYVISHAAGTSKGNDTFNAYYENNGTPGYQSGSSDVAATPLTLKFATLAITTGDTQAQQNTTVTVKFHVAGIDGTPFASRKVSVSLSGTDANFPTTQPSGTTRTGTATAVAVTDSNGDINVSVADPTAGSDTVTVTDNLTEGNQIMTGVSATSTIDYRALSVALTVASKSSPYALFPSGSSGDRPGIPGAPIVDNYCLSDANSAPLRNVSVTVSTDHGFFTPPPTSSGDYTTLTFTSAPANGAMVGDLKNLGSSQTVTTDGSGCVLLALGIGRDAAFDNNGWVNAKLTFSANGGSVVVNNPADTYQPGTDFSGTWTTDQNNYWWMGSLYAPLNPGTVQLLPATANDHLSGNVEENNGTNFIVHLTDQFGNLVRSANCSDVQLTETGPGALDSSCTSGSYLNSGYIDTINVSGNSGSVTAQAETVTATWTARTSVWKITGTPPSTTTTVDQTGTATKTDSFTINLYAVDKQHLKYTFSITPSGNAPVNSAVTSSVTVLDQYDNPASVCVDFFRSGPGSQSGQGSQCTNSAGKAGYTFSSSSTGTATVTAVVKDGSGNELSRGVTSVNFVSGTSSALVINSPSTYYTTVPGGSVVHVTGVGGVAGDVLTIHRKIGNGSYTTLAGPTVASDGTWSFNLKVTTTTAFYVTGSNGTSGVKVILTTLNITVPSTYYTTVAKGQRVAIYGSGARPGAVLSIWTKSGSQKTFVKRTNTVTATSYGTWALRFNVYGPIAIYFTGANGKSDTVVYRVS